jgi:hypothetical protein
MKAVMGNPGHRGKTQQGSNGQHNVKRMPGGRESGR